MNMSQWIRAARTHAGLSQSALGATVGVGKANVSSWENGLHRASAEQLRRISEITRFPLDIDEGLLDLDDKSLAAWIRNARKHAELTQAKLAEYLDVSKSNISHWELGYHRAREDQIRAIATITGYAIPGTDGQAKGVNAPMMPSWPSWPFTRISPVKLQRLNPQQAVAVEAALLGVTASLGIDIGAL